MFLSTSNLYYFLWFLPFSFFLSRITTHVWNFHYKEASENKLFVIFRINWYQQFILFIFSFLNTSCILLFYEAREWPEPYDSFVLTLLLSFRRKRRLPHKESLGYSFVYLFRKRVPALYYVPSSTVGIPNKTENRVSGSESLLSRQGKYVISKMNIKHVK